MTTDLEARARALCQNDAQAAAVNAAIIPELVERLWPAAAYEMSGGVFETGLIAVPDDIDKRIEEFRKLRR